MKYIKQFGVQRSGTNIVKALLEINFDVRVLNLVLGNKHLPFDAAAAETWAPTDEIAPKLALASGELEEIRRSYLDGTIGCTLVIKEPRAWLRSIYRYRCYKASKAVAFDAKFIRLNLESWIERNTGWLDGLPKHFRQVIVVQYEEILSSPLNFLLRHRDAYQLVPLTNYPTTTLPLTARAAADKDRGEAILGTKKFDSRYYLENAFLEEFRPDAMGLVEEILSSIPQQLKPFI